MRFLRELLSDESGAVAVEWHSSAHRSFLLLLLATIELGLTSHDPGDDGRRDA